MPVNGSVDGLSSPLSPLPRSPAEASTRRLAARRVLRPGRGRLRAARATAGFGLGGSRPAGARVSPLRSLGTRWPGGPARGLGPGDGGDGAPAAPPRPARRRCGPDRGGRGLGAIGACAIASPTVFSSSATCPGTSPAVPRARAQAAQPLRRSLPRWSGSGFDDSSPAFLSTWLPTGILIGPADGSAGEPLSLGGDRRRLGHGEQPDEALHAALVAIDLDVPGAERVRAARAAVGQREQRGGVRREGRVGGGGARRARSPAVPPQPRRGRPARPGAGRGSPEVARERGVEQGLQRQDVRVHAHPASSASAPSGARAPQRPSATSTGSSSRPQSVSSYTCDAAGGGSLRR